MFLELSYLVLQKIRVNSFTKLNTIAKTNLCRCNLKVGMPLNANYETCANKLGGNAISEMV